MIRYAMGRLLAAIPTLFVLITLAFFMMRAAPGGPFDRERSLLPEIEQAIKAAYHLDEPLPQQYLRYMGGLLRGDLGPSFQYAGYSVSELILQGLPVSATIGLSSLLIAVLVGGAAGIWAARRQNHLADYSVMTLSMAGISLPSYVVAPLLILLFAVVLGWLPASGWEQGRYSDLVLPITALALPQIAYMARMMRGSMIEVLRSNFIRTARAKGLPESTVILRHALKPALMPILSLLGPAAAGVITGSVVIEQIFAMPGIGRYFVQAAINRDYTLVLGVVIFYGTLIVLFNFVVDLLYSALDPRVRLQ
ncbi:MAG TPA: oligopeptide ABC transporter permease OppB [Solimonas sp.]|nr:oligopeptide ABC transporter permease OppB [Solimonas sp.]